MCSSDSLYTRPPKLLCIDLIEATNRLIPSFSITLSFLSPAHDSHGFRVSDVYITYELFCIRLVLQVAVLRVDARPHIAKLVAGVNCKTEQNIKRSYAL